MSFFKKIFSKAKDEVIPPDMQVNIMCGKFDTNELLGRIQGHKLHPEVYNIIGNGFRNKKEYDLAEDFYNKAIKADKKNGDFYGNLMSLYVEIEEYDKCEKLFNDAVKNINRGHEFVYFHQARSYAIQNDLAKALDNANKGISLSGEGYEPLYVLDIQLLIQSAKLMLDNGRKDDAEDIMQTAGKGIQVALHLFPDSERVKELYKDIFE